MAPTGTSALQGREDVSEKALFHLRQWRRWMPHMPVALWMLMTFVIAVIAWLQPHRLNMMVYRTAVNAWWNGAQVYTDGIHGFLYFPTSIVLFMPFVAFGSGWDDQIWRLASLLIYMGAVWRLVRLLAGEHSYTVAGIALLLLLPASGSDLLRGQATIAMMGLIIHAALEVHHERWTSAAILSALSLALKPLAIVYVLIAMVLYKPLRWRLPLALLVFLVLPYAFGSIEYVTAQYVAAIHKLLIAGQPDTGRWNDLAAILTAAQIDLPKWVILGLRVLAAGIVLGALIFAVRRPQPLAALLPMMLSITYILVFNPRTEQGGYMTLALFCGLATGLAWISSRRWMVAIGAPFTLAFGNQVYGNTLYRATDMWLKPTLGLVCLTGLVALSLWPRSKAPVTESSAPLPDVNIAPLSAE